MIRLFGSATQSQRKRIHFTTAETGMPRIVDSHLLGNQAVTEVQSILARAGVLSEIVKNDYGEDLLVQTHENGDADPFHIFIQVKGTARLNRSRDGALIYRFGIEHLFRWVSQIGSTLICVFDAKSKVTYAIDPKMHFTLWDLSTTRSRTKAVRLSEENVFSAESAKGVVWRARIQYYSNLLAIAENRQSYLDLHGIERRYRRRAQLDVGVICLNFLKMIGFLIGDEIKEQVRRQFRNGAPYFSEHFNDDGTCSLRHVMMFIIIGEVNEVTGQAVPSNLIEHATELGGHIYRLTYPDEWQAASEYFKPRWTPYKGLDVE